MENGAFALKEQILHFQGVIMEWRVKTLIKHWHRFDLYADQL